jgi:hypothetical protein
MYKMQSQKIHNREKNFARDYNACHHIENPIVSTIFHCDRFGLRNVFVIVF